MAYHECLRDLEGLRWLLRDFLVNGYRTRGDYQPASVRTYDNERRRIEGVLGEALMWKYGEKGKQYFYSTDASLLLENPLHRMYRLHNFTRTDISLHFLLLDVLADGREASLNEIVDEVSEISGEIFDAQTVRRKLNAYKAEGLIRCRTVSNRQLYALSAPTLSDVLPDAPESENLLAFFREAMPFGSLADAMMLRAGFSNRHIRFKHHFIMYTLDDAVCLNILNAMHEGKGIRLITEHHTSGKAPDQQRMLPVGIRVSQKTGRRYLVGWDLNENRPRSLRIDYLRDISAEDPPENAPEIRRRMEETLKNVWGVSLFGEKETEHIRMELYINEMTERYVLDRLKREGRDGVVTRVEANHYFYDADVYDTGEMMSWIKTFTGRILSLTGDNAPVIDRFYDDMNRMAEIYGESIHE